MDIQHICMYLGKKVRSILGHIKPEKKPEKNEREYWIPMPLEAYSLPKPTFMTDLARWKVVLHESQLSFRESIGVQYIFLYPETNDSRGLIQIIFRKSEETFIAICPKETK